MRWVSFEALIRWNSSKFGWVMPGEFISLAEETGLIVSIGEWVFKEACIQSTIWKKKGYKFDFISVNVSTVQLKESGFIDMVKRILLETNVDPKTIEVEITESVAIESLKKNCKIINELKKMGIRVALDDFGSGYSSLNYLKSIPINTIKIDKTFIDGICKYDYENIITGEIINLAHRMNLDVIAEGVEEEDQVNFLRTKSCNKIQGYYFGKPMPSENIDNMLRNKINI
jgi:EAL domain-containing protein (putative c-di-GMP-specific phosphodiesterase class I)